MVANCDRALFLPELRRKSSRANMIFSEQIGLEVIEALQTHEWLAVPMQGMTWMGSELFFLLFVALLYWCVSPRLGVQVGAILPQCCKKAPAIIFDLAVR
jgi:hypothetical protein